MSTIEILITQLIISLIVVTLYHLWSSRAKHPAPPNLNLNPNPNLLPVSRAPEPAPPASSPAPMQSALSAVPSAVALAKAEIPNPQSAIRNPQSAIPPPPPEILAVIAAAITVALGRPHRVVSIEQSAYTPEVNVWALEGRMKQFMSHKVR